MILENGLVRTLDPQIPTQRALAIAGEWIAGGVGTHETALASPDVVDLGGRVVLPGLNDAHGHFPSWALAQSQIDLDGSASLDEVLARIRSAGRASGRVLRGRGWRSGDWGGDWGGADPTKELLDGVVGDAPAAMIAKDGHSLWLNSAALALANGDLEKVEGGVVERDESGEPTGVLREESAWRFQSRYLRATADEYVEAMRHGLRLAASRGVTAVHDKDGGLGALDFWQRLERESALSLRVWQSVPHEQLAELRALGVRSGFGSRLLRLGYLKVFMDGTLGSQTAWMLDGSGVQITSGEHLAEIVREAAGAGWPVAVHAIGDRANRDALDAFEATADAWHPLGLRQRIEHAQLLAPEDLPRFAALGVAASVGLVRRQALEADQAPGRVVGALVGNEVADEVPAAARDDAAPLKAVVAERLELEAGQGQGQGQGARAPGRQGEGALREPGGVRGLPTPPRRAPRSAAGPPARAAARARSAAAARAGATRSRVRSNASSASRFARSPIACTATGNPASAASRDDRGELLAARDLHAASRRASSAVCEPSVPSMNTFR